MSRLAGKAIGDKAFSVWLENSLRQQFAAVMKEPLPQEWHDVIDGTAEVLNESPEG